MITFIGPHNGVIDKGTLASGYFPHTKLVSLLIQYSKNTVREFKSI